MKDKGKVWTASETHFLHNETQFLQQETHIWPRETHFSLNNGKLAPINFVVLGVLYQLSGSGRANMSTDSHIA